MSSTTRKKRDEKGLCTRCGGERDNPSTKECNSCREKSILSYQNKDHTHFRRLKEGFCIKCGKVPPEDGKRMCRSCLDFMREKYYNDRKSRGICPLCKKNEIPKGSSSCAACREIAKIKRKENLENGICSSCGTRPRMYPHSCCEHCLEVKRNHRAIKKGDGFCTSCFIGIPVDGKTMCEKCLGHRRKQRIKKIENGICVSCGDRKALAGRTFCQECSDRNKKYRDNDKKDAINAYGGKCSCCGESEIIFLTIDHVNNNGSEHRKQIGTGHNIYIWLRKNGYPQGDYQVLCFNCNQGRYINGGICPHKTKEKNVQP